MAEYALEKYKFDKIIFIPSYLPPHKTVDSNLAEHRYKMVEIATRNNPHFEVSDIEYKSEGKSYSLITVKKIIEQYKLSNRLNFIIGTDAFAKINSWYKPEELKNLVHFIVFPRRGDEISGLDDWDYEITEMDFVDISSTEIRGGKSNNLNSVEDYIKNNGLY